MIKVPGLKLSHALRAAALFASPDVTRSTMRDIHIELTNGALRLVATDGHAMMVADVEGDAIAAGHVGRVARLSLDDVARIARVAKEHTIAEVAIGVDAHRTITIAGIVVSSACVDAFAPYRNVLPSLSSMLHGKRSASLCMAPVQMLRAAEAVKIYAAGHVVPVAKSDPKARQEETRARNDLYRRASLSFVANGELDPTFVVSPEVPTLAIVVMPMRPGIAMRDGRSVDAHALDVAPFVERVREIPPVAAIEPTGARARLRRVG